MFEKIKRLIKGKIETGKCVSGLSAGMDIVDKYMCPGMNPRAVDFSAGYAQARIHELYEKGRITKEEMSAAMFTLENQQDKLYQRALIEEMLG